MKMTKRIMNRLDMLQSAALLAYVKEHYAEAKMSDEKFAEKATADLGFKVLESHVEKRRIVLQIGPTSNRPGPKNTAALFALVLELEKRIAALEKQAQARLPGM
jgi:hypothetical protein